MQNGENDELEMPVKVEGTKCGGHSTHCFDLFYTEVRLARSVPLCSDLIRIYFDLHAATSRIRRARFRNFKISTSITRSGWASQMKHMIILCEANIARR
jgi:hypothetical protein